jgi:hypothetical protein
MAKKLRLDLEELQVESFAASPEEDQRGTVAGYQTDYVGSCVNTCTTCENTCETCVFSCEATCESCITCFTCVRCRTNMGPDCTTQKQTGPCGAC